MSADADGYTRNRVGRTGCQSREIMGRGSRLNPRDLYANPGRSRGPVELRVGFRSKRSFDMDRLLVQLRNSLDFARWLPAIQHALIAFLVVAAVAFATWQRLGREAQEGGITGDEAISLLAATCHQREFREAISGHRAPYGRWVPARSWRRFVEPDAFACFGTISRDLAELDLHPPLYFWILHLWLPVFGLHRCTLVALNLLFAGGTLAGLVVLGRRLFGSTLSGSVLALLWGASPLPAVAGTQGRPYELLAFATVWFFVELVACCDPTVLGRWRLPRLALWTVIGVLTHYFFLIVLAGAGAYACTRLLLQRNPKRLVLIGAAVITGLCFASLVHPMAAQVVPRHKKSWLALGSEKSSKLAGKALARQEDFFAKIETGCVRAGPVAPVGLVLIGLVSVTAIRRRRDEPVAFRPSTQGADILVAVGATVLLTIYFCAIGRISARAINAKYLSFLWPLLPLVLVIGARLLPALRVPMQAALVWTSVVAGWQTGPIGADFRALGQPFTRPDAQPLAFIVDTWHPTAATIAQHDDDDLLFVTTPADSIGALYGAWLQPAEHGGSVNACVTREAKEIVARLRADGYNVQQRRTRDTGVKWFSVSR